MRRRRRSGIHARLLDDRAALEAFAAKVDVVTYEFENLPVDPLRVLGDKLRPGTRSLAVAQDRAVEKQFIEGMRSRGRAMARRRQSGSGRDRRRRGARRTARAQDPALRL